MQIVPAMKTLLSMLTASPRRWWGMIPGLNYREGSSLKVNLGDHKTPLGAICLISKLWTFFLWDMTHKHPTDQFYELSLGNFDWSLSASLLRIQKPRSILRFWAAHQHIHPLLYRLRVYSWSWVWGYEGLSKFYLMYIYIYFKFIVHNAKRKAKQHIYPEEASGWSQKLESESSSCQ